MKIRAVIYFDFKSIIQLPMTKALLFALLLLSLQSKSQSGVSPVTPATFNTGGGSAVITSSFTVDWSIGESTAIETWYGENSYANSIVGIKWNVTSGILQPFDKNHIIFNFQVPYFTSEEIRVYPIPAPNIVYIDFRSALKGKLTVHLLSLDGKLLDIKEFKQVDGNTTISWNISNRPSGFYYFRVMLTSDKGDILKRGTFKFEKIQ